MDRSDDFQLILKRLQQREDALPPVQLVRIDAGGFRATKGRKPREQTPSPPVQVPEGSTPALPSPGVSERPKVAGSPIPNPASSARPEQEPSPEPPGPGIGDPASFARPELEG